MISDKKRAELRAIKKNGKKKKNKKDILNSIKEISKIIDSTFYK
jgi:hypothetical protein